MIQDFLGQTWRPQAACLGRTDDFFFSGHASDREVRVRENYAKSICADCPVLEECQEYALTGDDVDAVMGGWTLAERSRLIARRKRQLRASA